MRLHERFCNLLKMNRFHGCLCGEPHESSLNSYNGKIRIMVIDGGLPHEAAERLAWAGLQTPGAAL
jgi:hypothetical protein